MRSARTSEGQAEHDGCLVFDGHLRVLDLSFLDMQRRLGIQFLTILQGLLVICLVTSGGLRKPLVEIIRVH